MCFVWKRFGWVGRGNLKSKRVWFVACLNLTKIPAWLNEMGDCCCFVGLSEAQMQVSSILRKTEHIIRHYISENKDLYPI